MIEGAELKQRLRGATTDWKIAGFEEDSGSFDPEVATFVMAEYAKKWVSKFSQTVQPVV